MIYPVLFDNVSAIFFPDQTLYDDDDWGQDIGQFSTFSNKSSIWIAELRDQNRKVVGLERSVLGKTNDF